MLCPETGARGEVFMFNLDDETVRRVCESHKEKCDSNAPIRNENFLDACVRGAEKIDDKTRTMLQKALGKGSGI